MKRLALLLVLLLATPASAAPRLAVSKTTGLKVAGETVTVKGSGYDRNKGIYVAFCVDNGPGEVPTPCGGGADTEGSSGNSVWISDFPPAYGTGLARPYGDGGSFEVQIRVQAQLDEETDCRVVRCAVVTRNDHTRSDDRTQDVRVPIAFATTGTAARPAPAPARPSASSRPSQGGGAPVLPRTDTAAPTPTTSTGATGTPGAGVPAAAAPAPTATTPVTDVEPGPDLADGPAAPQAERRGWLVAVALVAAAAAGAGVVRARRR